MLVEDVVEGGLVSSAEEELYAGFVYAGGGRTSMVVVSTAGGPPVAVTMVVYVLVGLGGRVVTSPATWDEASTLEDDDEEEEGKMVMVTWEEMRVIKVERRTVSVACDGEGGPLVPHRSVMVIVVKGVDQVVVRGQLQLIWTSVMVGASPEMVASGRPVVTDTSVWTFVTVDGLPETVASGAPGV